MPESLLNYRLRGTTLPYEELLIALENIIIDKVTTHSTSKEKNIDTSAPMEIGMAAGTDGEEAFEEGTEKHLKSQCRQCTGEQEPEVDGVEERVAVGAYMSTSSAERVKKERIVLERDSGPRPEARKEEKGKRKVANMTSEFAGAVGKQDTLLPPDDLLHPVCGFNRPRVYRHHAHMFKHMYAWCWQTRGRFECTHGGVFGIHTRVFSTFFNVPQHTQTNKHTHTKHPPRPPTTPRPQRHTTQHNTQHHTETERRQRKTERRQRKRETREDETGQEKKR